MSTTEMATDSLSRLKNSSSRHQLYRLIYCLFCLALLQVQLIASNEDQSAATSGNPELRLLTTSLRPDSHRQLPQSGQVPVNSTLKPSEAAIFEALRAAYPTGLAYLDACKVAKNKAFLPTLTRVLKNPEFSPLWSNSLLFLGWKGGIEAPSLIQSTIESLRRPSPETAISGDIAYWTYYSSFHAIGAWLALDRSDSKAKRDELFKILEEASRPFYFQQAHPESATARMSQQQEFQLSLVAVEGLGISGTSEAESILFAASEKLREHQKPEFIAGTEIKQRTYFGPKSKLSLEEITSILDSMASMIDWAKDKNLSIQRNGLRQLPGYDYPTTCK